MVAKEVAFPLIIKYAYSKEGSKTPSVNRNVFKNTTVIFLFLLQFSFVFRVTNKLAYYVMPAKTFIVEYESF